MGAFVRSTAGVAYNSSSATITPFSGTPQLGDIRYIFSAANVPGLTGPTGWTQLYNATASGVTMGLWWKEYVSSEVSVFVTLSSTGDGVTIVTTVAAGDPAGTPQSTTNTGSSTTLTASGLTPAVANDLEMAFFSTWLTSNATTATLSTPTGMTAGGTYHPSAATGLVGMAASRSLTGTGATGSSTSTASQTGTWRTATALHPPGPVVTGSQPGEFMSFFGGGL